MIRTKETPNQPVEMKDWLAEGDMAASQDCKAAKPFLHSLLQQHLVMEGILGDFLDAFKAGQQAKQDRIEQEQKRTAAEQQKVHDADSAARKWVSDVLAPIVAEAGKDVAALGRITISDASKPPIVAQDVQIAFTGRKPSKLSFLIKDGAITTFRDGSQGNAIGAITTVGQAQISQLLQNILKSMGEA
jgi:hypothetical protein